MNWFAQAIHVARKDIRPARWLFGICVLVIIAGTLHALTLMPNALPPINMWSLALLIFGIFLAAQIVQLDSPARSDAFWVSRPLIPSAVLTAKFLGIAGITLVALVAQALVLTWLAVPVNEMPLMLFDAGLGFVLTLLDCALLAAVTPNLRTFAVALFGYLFAIPYAFQALFPRMSAIETTPGMNYPYMLALLLITGLLLLYAYRARRLAMSRILVVLLLVATLTANTLGLSQPLQPAMIGTLSADGVRSDIKIKDYETIAQDDRHVMLIRLDTARRAPDLRYLMISPRIYLEDRNGARQRLRMPLFMEQLDLSVPGNAFTGRAIVGENRTGVANGIVQVVVSRRQHEGIRQRELFPVIDAVVAVMQPHPLATLPLTKGATAVVSGRRMQITQTGTGMPFSNIGFDMSDVPRPAWRFTSFPLSTRYVNPPMEWALVNASRNEALPLETKGVMTGTLLPIPVYPGSRSSRELEIRGSSRSQPNFVPDSSWLAGAELHMVEWVEIGSYRLRIATDSGALIVR